MHQRYSPRLDARLPCESHSLDVAMILHGRIAAFLIYVAAATHPVCYFPGSACFCFMKRDGGSWSFVININMISALDAARYCSNYGNLRLWYYLPWMRISRKLRHYMGRVSLEFVLFESHVCSYWVWYLSWCPQQPSINTCHPCRRASIACWKRHRRRHPQNYLSKHALEVPFQRHGIYPRGGKKAQGLDPKW